ncbi:DUF4365 domain-containing protein [Arthrobacter sp. USHLN218]|uniref:DUF4365 domain-containing protein n=1 Tax=Arthrobacter sp. USHLN218 TaxID=3081232 RepID=UPI0030179FFC
MISSRIGIWRSFGAPLANDGIQVECPRDHAAIDTGLHLFLEGPGNNFQSTHTRVWFQAKGKRVATLSAEQFDAAAEASVSVKVEHLEYWFAAPEPVYLVVFVEAKLLFIAEDVRAIVYRMWPDGNFYDAVHEQESVTVHLDKEAVLDGGRIASLLSHESMRIDGAKRNLKVVVPRISARRASHETSYRRE